MSIVGGMHVAHIPVLPGVGEYLAGAELPPPVAAALERMVEPMRRDVELLIEMRERFVAFGADAIVFFDSDHLNTFFLDHVPSIAVGVDDTTSGPSDHPLGHPDHPSIPVDRALADTVHRGLIDRLFDVSRAQRFTLDHSMTVPLHYVTPDMDVPVVPVWINGLGGVPIRSQRALALGRAVAEIINEAAPERRIVVMSSGAISFDIGTPRVFPNAVFGIPDPEWVARVGELLISGDVDQLVEEATPDRLRDAGNAAAELLDTIALIGAVDGSGVRPEFFELREDHAHVFAVWSAEPEGA